MNKLARATISSLLALSILPGLAQLKTQVYATGLSVPIAMAQDPTMPNVQLVLQQSGLIRVIKDGAVLPTPFLDLTGSVNFAGEQGLLGIAFSPNYATDGFVFLQLNEKGTGATRIVRYSRDPIDPLKANPQSLKNIFMLPKPFNNHNGGTIRFGPLDGYLYLGLGDGGSGNDPGNRAQDPNQLYGKFLRIDPFGPDAYPGNADQNYAIPADNPFRDGVPIAALPEIWDFGVRNPFKWSFDTPSLLGNGGILIGDVGQSSWEEIDYEPPLTGGFNYGWRVKEGFQDTGLGGKSFDPLTDPLIALDRTQAKTIIGGYVYRGTLLGDYFGRYIFVDYLTDKVFSFLLGYNPDGSGVAKDFKEHTSDVGPIGGVVSIDTDSQGELYFVDYDGGRILRLLPENRTWITQVTPVLGGFSGNIRHLLASDDKRLRVLPINFIQNGESSPTEIQVVFASDQLTGNTLFIDIEEAISKATNAKLRVSLKNWSTGNFDVVGTFDTNGTDQRFSLTAPASLYRRNDGRMEMRLRSYKVSPQLVTSFDMLLDQVRVDIR